MELVDTAGPPTQSDTANAPRAASTSFAAELNQIFRRLRHYDSEEQWLAALRDGVAQHASEFAIFTVQNGMLRMRSQKNMALGESLEFPVLATPGFADAIESREPTVVLRTASEVGAALQSNSKTARARLFPIANASRVVAILFASDAGDSAASALELIAGFAETAFDRHTGRNPPLQIDAAPPRTEARGGPPKSDERIAGMTFPTWAKLEPNQRAQHGRALRFARVTVASLQIARPEAALAGRKQNNIYMFLQAEIDKARESYRTQFLGSPSMVDYLHLELVQTMASGEEHKLGVDYPGQLV